MDKVELISMAIENGIHEKTGNVSLLAAFTVDVNGTNHPFSISVEEELRPYNLHPVQVLRADVMSFEAFNGYGKVTKGKIYYYTQNHDHFADAKMFDMVYVDDSNLELVKTYYFKNNRLIKERYSSKLLLDLYQELLDSFPVCKFYEELFANFHVKVDYVKEQLENYCSDKKSDIESHGGYKEARYKKIADIFLDRLNKINVQLNVSKPNNI